MKTLLKLLPGLAFAAVAIGVMLLADLVDIRMSSFETGIAQGRYVPPGGGEILVLRQPPIPGDVSIKVSPNFGDSNRFSMGSQDLPPTYAIPVHKHLAQDEVLFVYSGSGTATLGEDTFDVEAGSTLYIPQGVWHTVVNNTDDPAQLLWITAAPGIEDFFIRIGVKPGEPWTPMSLAELTKISAEYGMIIKPE